MVRRVGPRSEHLQLVHPHESTPIDGYMFLVCKASVASKEKGRQLPRLALNVAIIAIRACVIESRYGRRGFPAWTEEMETEDATDHAKALWPGDYR
jgi:hypothetical protein